MRLQDLHAILSCINCNSRQTRIFSLQIASWISNGVSHPAQISKPLDALRARLLLTSCCEGLEDYACASKDCVVGVREVVVLTCQIREVSERVFDLFAPDRIVSPSLSCLVMCWRENFDDSCIRNSLLISFGSVAGRASISTVCGGRL